MAEKDYAEALFESIQTLIDGSVSSLEYDKTITCTIVNNNNRARGEYIVSDGASTFPAYSDITTYTPDTSVYVVVPQGNYENKKIILGRRTSSDSPYFNYVAPTATYVDITDNIVNNIDGVSILANGNVKMKLIYENNNIYSGYDRIGFKADFRTALSSLNPVNGDYGLYIKIKHADDIDINKIDETIFEFGQNEMYGDVYNFNYYYNQEAVYDVSQLGAIKGIQVYLYQKSNFNRIINSADGEDTYELIPHTSSMKIGGSIIEEDLPDNIFVDNLYISFGYDLNNFNEDKVIVYTLDPIEYDSGDKAEDRIRTLHLRWIHKTEDGIISVKENELDTYGAQVYWHRYSLDKVNGDFVNSRYGGLYWDEIKVKEYNDGNYPIVLENSPYTCIALCDTTVQNEYFKAIITTKSASLIEYANELYTELSRFDLFAEDRLTDILELLENYSNNQNHYDIYVALLDLQDNLNPDSKLYNDQVRFLEKALNNWQPYAIADFYEGILTIHNTAQVQAKLAVDLVLSITISVGDEDDPYKGVYMIYGEDGQILNKVMSTNRQKLVLSYNSLLTGMNEFDGDGSEVITWKIPLTDTMILAPKEGIEYNGGTFVNQDGIEISNFEYHDDSGNLLPDSDGATWAYINKKISKQDDEIGIGGFDCKTTEQIFRIKDYFSSVGRNTIYCVIEKGGYQYVADITLIFGTSGTNGTDYTFRLVPNNTALSSGTQLNITPQLYDYNNTPIVIPNDKITTKFIHLNLNSAISYSDDTFSNVDEINGLDIHYEGNKLNDDTFYPVLKSTVAINITNRDDDEAPEKLVKLTAYLPIAWSADLALYNHFQGPDRIIYSTSGTDPQYYKGSFKLFNQLDEEVSGLTWSLKIYDDEGAEKFYPSVIEKEDGYTLRAPSMFIKENHLCKIVGKAGNDIVWELPLLIIQNAFSSALLNNWNGDLTIDEENGTIMTPVLGAGKKNSDNSFSGVLIGDVAKVNTTTNNMTGVYGYQNGIQSFSLTENGVATFGASDKGLIIIDGTQGTIRSGDYSVDNKTGMEIDLHEGMIDAYNFKLKSKNISMDSSPDAHNYFTITGNDEITTRSFSYDEKGFLEKDGVHESENPVEVSLKLINIGNSSFYLLTIDYSESNEQGLKFDLLKGRLNAYSGFKLEAINHLVRVSVDNDTDKTQYPEYYSKIGSNDNFSFDKVKLINYKNYYFTLEDEDGKEKEKDGKPDYHNDWDKFENAPFKYNYELVNTKDEDGNSIPATTVTNNYNTLWKNYFYKYSSYDTDGKPVISENEADNKYTAFDEKHYWKGINYYRKKDIIGLDNTILYDEKTKISNIYKLTTTQTLVKLATLKTEEEIKDISTFTVSGNQYTITSYDVNLVKLESKGYYYFDADDGKFKQMGTATIEDDGKVAKLTSGVSGITTIYGRHGSYQKGSLIFDSEADQYPLKLTLGSATPFKLSWAGFLYAEKLHATGGTVGGWKIEPGSISSKDLTLLALDLNGIASIFLGDYAGVFIPTKYDLSKIDNDDKIGISSTTFEEYSNKQPYLNKYTSEGYYIKSINSPYYSGTYDYSQMPDDKKKLSILFRSDGTAIIGDLLIKGGDGYWGGTAKHSETTNPYGHTHILSIEHTYNKATTGAQLYQAISSSSDTLTLKKVSDQNITIKISGNSSSSTFTFDPPSAYPNTTGNIMTYYSEKKLEKATKKYWTSMRFNVSFTYTNVLGKSQTVNLGLIVYAYRYGDDKLGMSRYAPDGTWVSCA